MYEFSWLLVICIIGRASAERVATADARDHEFAHAVSIKVNGTHRCGGAIVSDQHILTSADCVIGLLESPMHHVTVLTGTNHLSNGGETHSVSSYFHHPDYIKNVNNPETNWKHDIAVIKLNRPIEHNDHQKAIDPPSYLQPPVNKHGIVSAWGSGSKSHVSPTLLTLPVKILSHRKCQKRFNFDVAEEMLCGLREKDKDICSGDSGSPLIFNNEIIGVVPGGNPCTIDSTDVFTSIQPYVGLIGRWLTH